MSESKPYFSQDELPNLGFRSVGHNVLISRKASIYSPGAMRIGSNVRIDDFVVITAREEVVIGDFVHISCLTFLHGHAKILIGNFVQISSRVGIYTSSSDFLGDSLSNPMIPAEFNGIAPSGPIELKDHVIVGTGSTVLHGTVIGEGSTIGANSLVLSSLAPWGVYAGVPVKRLKDRPSGTVLDQAKAVIASI